MSFSDKVKQEKETIDDVFERIIPKEYRDMFKGTANNRRWTRDTRVQYKTIMIRMSKTDIGLKKGYNKNEATRLLQEMREQSSKNKLKDTYDYFIHMSVRSIVNNVLYDPDDEESMEWTLKQPKVRDTNIDKLVFSKDRIENMIEQAKKIENEEMMETVMDFCVSTIYGVRRVELSRLTADDVEDDSIYIRTGKGGEARRHLIPDEIKPFVSEKFARGREYSAAYISYQFKNLESELGFEHRKGYSYHAIRRRLATELGVVYKGMDGEDSELDREDLFSFFRWSEGEDILDEYLLFSEEELDKSQEYIDKRVFEVHPFLDCWG